MLEPNCYNNNFNSHIGLVVFGLVMFVQINSQTFVIVEIWKRFSFHSMPFRCSMYVCTYVYPQFHYALTHIRIVWYRTRALVAPAQFRSRFSSRSPSCWCCAVLLCWCAEVSLPTYEYTYAIIASQHTSSWYILNFFTTQKEFFMNVVGFKVGVGVGVEVEMAVGVGVAGSIGHAEWCIRRKSGERECIISSHTITQYHHLIMLDKVSLSIYI